MKTRLVSMLFSVTLLFPGSLALAGSRVQSGKTEPKVRHTILVNKGDNTLRYYVTGQKVRVFRVATGLYKCTPQGRFRVVQKSYISSRGGGPFGTRWIGLNTRGKRGWYNIGIHGTNKPQTIGRYASKACVRMRNQEINWLYAQVPYGTTVRIVDVPVAPRKTRIVVASWPPSSFNKPNDWRFPLGRQVTWMP